MPQRGRFIASFAALVWLATGCGTAAPDMPSGVEDLRFPPGWRDPVSDNFWSYAIVLRLDEPTPTTARVEELTDIYYTGLMSAFGVGQNPESPPNDVDVDLDHQRLDLSDHRIVEQLIGKVDTPVVEHDALDDEARHAACLWLRLACWQTLE